MQREEVVCSHVDSRLRRPQKAPRNQWGITYSLSIYPKINKFTFSHKYSLHFPLVEAVVELSSPLDDLLHC